ncbi:hypothetical protein [Deinococcus roseus]|uniref:Uncharacterized protein n=1 Tax=Deinococcus roseus TaxID=392414 RepID=A0ABQ2CWV0_9DEIO|nr:hypothetical protein [Deinococcus roseus]GGJ28817.1 hypothetical protein GCM10008938_13640 [Deinococcus roseus]
MLLVLEAQQPQVLQAVHRQVQVLVVQAQQSQDQALEPLEGLWMPFEVWLLPLEQQEVPEKPEGFAEKNCCGNTENPDWDAGTCAAARIVRIAHVDVPELLQCWKHHLQGGLCLFGAGFGCV